jgi:hypothetical protein
LAGQIFVRLPFLKYGLPLVISIGHWQGAISSPGDKQYMSWLAGNVYLLLQS